MNNLKKIRVFYYEGTYRIHEMTGIVNERINGIKLHVGHTLELSELESLNEHPDIEVTVFC